MQISLREHKGLVDPRLSGLNRAPLDFVKIFFFWLIRLFLPLDARIYE